MKKQFLLISLLATSASTFAASDAGCGVGAMIWEGKEGIVPNVLAATTNGISGNQTFGMTTGTLGCDNSASKGAIAINQYLDSNLDRVARDMSRGQGESMNVLASLLNIGEEDRATFLQVSKANFDFIFSSENSTRSDVVDALNIILKSHESLAKYAV